MSYNSHKDPIILIEIVTDYSQKYAGMLGSSLSLSLLINHFCLYKSLLIAKSHQYFKCFCISVVTCDCFEVLHAWI